MKNLTIFKVLTLSLLMCPLFSSAMEPEQTASDFEIYQLLSLAVKNDPEFTLPKDVVNTIASIAHEITEEENIAIAHAIDRTQALKKQLAEQNETMQNLADEMRALMQEYKDINEENNYLETLVKAQGKFVDEKGCLTQ